MRRAPATPAALFRALTPGQSVVIHSQDADLTGVVTFCTRDRVRVQTPEGVCTITASGFSHDRAWQLSRTVTPPEV
jgi:hypothetical protein